MVLLPQDHYAVLGISRSATVADIKTIFRKLALSYHPDKNPDNAAAAQEAFVKVRAAYEVLVNPTSRNRYDTAQAHRFQQSARAQNYQYQSGHPQHQGPPPTAPKAHRQNQSNQYRSQNEGRAQQEGWGHHRSYDKKPAGTAAEQAAWEAYERAEEQRQKNAWAEWKSESLKQEAETARRAEEVKRQQEEFRQRQAAWRASGRAEEQRQKEAWEKWEAEVKKCQQEEARQKQTTWEAEQCRQQESWDKWEADRVKREEKQARQREAEAKKPEKEDVRPRQSNWGCSGSGSSIWRDSGGDPEEKPHRPKDTWQKWEEELVKQQEEQARQKEAAQRYKRETMREEALRREVAEAVAKAHDEKLRKEQEEEMRKRPAENEVIRERAQETSDQKSKFVVEMAGLKLLQRRTWSGRRGETTRILGWAGVNRHLHQRSRILRMSNLLSLSRLASQNPETLGGQERTSFGPADPCKRLDPRKGRTRL